VRCVAISIGRGSTLHKIRRFGGCGEPAKEPGDEKKEAKRGGNARNPRSPFFFAFTCRRARAPKVRSVNEVIIR